MAETLHEMAVRMATGEDGEIRCGTGCDECPAVKWRDSNGVCLVRRFVKAWNCEEQIERLRAWAERNPREAYPTWDEWYKGTFPEAATKDAAICVASFDLIAHAKCDNMHCDDCRNKEIPAYIARRLGIKPITTAKAVPKHDDCDGCRWMDKHEDEEPCKNCCGARGGSSPDLWEEG